MPFIWIEIGPRGHAFYGPDVPDIYILGGTILGKDRNDPGIALASRFQLAMCLCFILCAYFLHGSKNGVLIFTLTLVQALLLLLFPFWLHLYVHGVINNSDGAASDLRVYPHLGLLLYVWLSMQVVIRLLGKEWHASPLRRQHQAGDGRTT